MLNMYKNPLFRQYVVVITANLSILAAGTGMIWPSPVLVKLNNSTQTVLPRPITEEEGSWIVSIKCVTGLAGILLSAIFVDIIGRKSGLIIACLPNIITGFIFIFSTEVWMVLLGRALVGFTEGVLFTLVPIYASEIASVEIRGGLGTILQVMCSFGSVIMLSMGPFISYIYLNIVYTCFIVLATIPLFLLPDSPYFLYSKGRNTEALQVLTLCRGSEALAQEELNEYKEAHEKKHQLNKKNLFTDRLFLKTLVKVVIFGLGAQLIGYNAVTYYLQTILESSRTSVQPEIASVIIGLIQVCGSFATIFMTDKYGRKPIITISNIGMAVGMLGLGIFFKLKENGIMDGFLNFVPLVSLTLIVFNYSTGMGSLIWVVSAELFDDKSRGIGVPITVFSFVIATFLTTKYFAMMISTIGPAYTYWIFSINCVLLSLFVMFCIPETKGKSFAEIQDILRKKSDYNKNCKTRC